MPLIKKSRNAIRRVWSGPCREGGKNNQKKVGVHVGINVGMDKLLQVMEAKFVNVVSDLLR